MEVKEGVELKDLHISMRPALIEADSIWRNHGRQEGVTITSTGDGVHSAGSLHPYGLAFDCRTRYFDEDVKLAVFDLLSERVPQGFQVIWHETHIHVENDWLGKALLKKYAYKSA